MGASVKVKVSFRTCRRSDEPAPARQVLGPASIARRMALAHHIESLIECGELRDYGDAANRLGLSRARLTQIADLALLAPDIQSAVLLGHVAPPDRHLREVGREQLWEGQIVSFAAMFPAASPPLTRIEPPVS